MKIVFLQICIYTAVAFISNFDLVAQVKPTSEDGLKFLKEVIPDAASQSVFPISRGLKTQEVQKNDGLLMRSYRLVPPSLKTNAKQAMENIGISFSNKGSRVNYDNGTEILQVVLPEEQLELVEIYLRNLSEKVTKRIVTQVEVYEMSSQLALEFIDRCDTERFHNTQRNAVLNRVNDGDVKLVHFTSAMGVNNNRPKSEDEDGYYLEFDSVLHENGNIISLEYAFTMPKNRIRASLHARFGKYYLVGSWKALANNRKETDRVQLVFLKCFVQKIHE